MTINIQTNRSFEAFINVVGNKQDTTTTEEHNKAVNAFIELFNAGKLTIDAFVGSDGKIVLGFR